MPTARILAPATLLAGIAALFATIAIGGGHPSPAPATSGFGAGPAQSAAAP